MTDKLFLMLLELCNGKYITADHLANKLDISTRSVYRYIDILSLSNIPVIGRRGNTGGYKIGEEFLIPNSYFTQQELDIISNAINQLPSGTNPTIISSVIVKLNATGIRYNTTPHNRSLIAYDNKSNDALQGKLIAIERAILSGNHVTIDYHSRNGEVSSRRIAPLNFINHSHDWYVYCYCYMRGDYRTFKLSRITHVDTSDIKHNISGDYPQRWSFTSESASNVQLVLQVDKSVLYLVEEWLGIEAISISGDNLIARAVVKDDDETYARIISLGANVKILAPLSVKTACRNLINTMHAHFNND